MKLSTAIALTAGGEGSGCNPEKGKCGRKPGAGEEKKAKGGYHLGDNRDYKSWGNKVNDSLAWHAKRTQELMQQGMSKDDASHQAYLEVKKLGNKGVAKEKAKTERPAKVAKTPQSYHGTTVEAAMSILKVGLKATDSTLGYKAAFAAVNKGLAISYGVGAAARNPKGGDVAIVVLKANAGMEYEGPRKNVLIMKGDIPPAAISHIEIYSREALKDKVPTPTKTIRAAASKESGYVVVLFKPRQEVQAGGKGSGCNPDVGKCGRPASGAKGIPNDKGIGTRRPGVDLSKSKPTGRFAQKESAFERYKRFMDEKKAAEKSDKSVKNNNKGVEKEKAKEGSGGWSEPKGWGATGPRTMTHPQHGEFKVVPGSKSVGKNRIGKSLGTVPSGRWNFWHSRDDKVVKSFWGVRKKEVNEYLAQFGLTIKDFYGGAGKKWKNMSDEERHAVAKKDPRQKSIYGPGHTKELTTPKAKELPTVQKELPKLIGDKKQRKLFGIGEIVMEPRAPFHAPSVKDPIEVEDDEREKDETAEQLRHAAPGGLPPLIPVRTAAPAVMAQRLRSRPRRY